MEQWTITQDRAQLPKGSGSYHSGAIYAIEYGEHLKIGRTKNLKERVRVLSRQAANYADLPIGRVAYTEYHAGYVANEKLLHERFSDNRKEGTELFDITLDAFLREAPLLRLSPPHPSNPEENLKLVRAIFDYFDGNGGWPSN